MSTNFIDAASIDSINCRNTEISIEHPKLTGEEPVILYQSINFVQYV